MKKLVSILVFLVVIATASFSGLMGVAAQGNGVDLCGGTGGNGQVVSVTSNTFTLKLDDGGQKGGGNLIVSLTKNATIETPTGYISVSDLKIGDRVTLVGDNNRDGTFTADAVVVCSGTEATGTEVNSENRTTPITVRNKNSEAYEKVNNSIYSVTIFLVGSIWLSISAFLLFKKKKSLVYLFFFTIFYIYLYKVIDYTLLQFQSLLILKHFVPGLMLRGYTEGKNVNLIPLITLTPEDVITSVLNILMMMPFGFGLPFITNFHMKKVVITGLFSSIAIEFLQLVTGFIANTTFRVADVNDLIFNTAGVAIGYILFIGFVRNIRQIFRNDKMSVNPILRYIANRPQADK